MNPPWSSIGLSDLLKLNFCFWPTSLTPAKVFFKKPDFEEARGTARVTGSLQVKQERIIGQRQRQEQVVQFKRELTSNCSPSRTAGRLLRVLRVLKSGNSPPEVTRDFFWCNYKSGHSFVRSEKATVLLKSYALDRLQHIWNAFGCQKQQISDIPSHFH